MVANRESFLLLAALISGMCWRLAWGADRAAQVPEPVPGTNAVESVQAAQDRLAAGFRQPPDDARPWVYWLWLNGYVNRDHLVAELRELHKAGIRGVCLFDMGARGPVDAQPPAGPAFLSDQWLDNLAAAVQAAGELGMEMELAVSSSWDMGGAWVQPAQASKGLYVAELELAGPREFDDVLPLPRLPLPGSDSGAAEAAPASESDPRGAWPTPPVVQDIAVLALRAERHLPGPDRDWPAADILDGRESGPAGSRASRGLPRLLLERPEAIVDLTDRVAGDGRLKWQVPPGRWLVERFVCAPTWERLKVPSPQSDGLVTDHFDGRSTRRFLEYVISRLQGRLGELRSSALTHLYLPSYEVRGRLWTPELPALFKRLRHYELEPYLPALAGHVVQSPEVTERFLYDYRKTLGDVLVEAYYQAAVEAAHGAGLKIEAEAGGPGPPVHQVPVDALKALGTIDTLRGEFWPRRPDAHALWVVKETACAAHIYGRCQVRMEAFTSMHHWQDGPFDLKPSADRAFCEGMNHVVWHTSAHLPPEAGKPGWVYHAGTHLNPNLVWWPQAGAFLDYLARCSFLLQQGLFVADVCYYYGDQGANFVPPKHVDPALGYGYDYDVVNREVILTRMDVRDGRLCLPDGMSYALLVLPDRPDIDIEVLQKIADLVARGATVVGPKPLRATGLGDFRRRDEEVRSLAEQLWGPCDGHKVREHRFGQGRVIWGRTLREVLHEKGIGPDFSVSKRVPETGGAARAEETQAAEQAIDFIHRCTPGVDIYFVRNRGPDWIGIAATFRVRDRCPELWDPSTGLIRPQYVFECTPNGVRLPLELAPYGSMFVVFRKRASYPPALLLQQPKPAGDYFRAQVTAWDGTCAALSVFQDGLYRLRAADGREAQVMIEALPQPMALAGPWDVQFVPGLGTPKQVWFAELLPWNKHPDPAVRYFSGIARYRCRFQVPAEWLAEDRRLWLDLGALWAVGEVWLGGRPLGVLWHPPFALEITNAAVPGENELVVAVANTWSNRLVGEARGETPTKLARTNVRSSGGLPWKDVPLIDSGLFGPVRLVPGKVVTLEPRPAD